MAKRTASLDGAIPVAEASRRILAFYRRETRRFARLVTRGNGNDVEPVHQLRVWTRRWCTALDVFRDGYSAGKVGRRKRQLHDLRRSAGVTRRMDVLLAAVELLENQVPLGERDSLQSMTQHLARERRAARKILRRKLREIEKRGFWKKCKKDLREPARFSHSEESLMDRSRVSLARALAKVEKRHARYLESQEFTSLHRLRIAGKRVRYTLEIFAGAARSLEEEDLAQSLRGLLKHLGNLNDYHEFADQLDTIGKLSQKSAIKTVTSTLAGHFRQKLADGRVEFEARWSSDFEPAVNAWKAQSARRDASELLVENS